MNDWKTVSMPTEAERERAVSNILESAFPRAETPYQRLISLFCALPSGTLFFGVGDCLFLAVLVAGLCAVPIYAAALEWREALPALVFFLSPSLYAFLQGLTMWKDRMSGTLEWRQTCRISFRTLTALRMMIFGGASVLVCVPANVLLWYLSGYPFTLYRMMSLSFSSLFFYAALSLLCQRTDHPLAIPAVPLLWVLLGIPLLFWEPVAPWLLEVPTLVFFLLAVCSLAVYLRELRLRLSDPFEGGMIHAVC